jgi:uncharacterized integral membrane protein
MTGQPERSDIPSPPANLAPPAREPAPEAPAGGAARPPLPQHTIRRTRISGTWAALASFAVILLLLLVFILQNSRTVDVSYFGAHGHLPLGVALLLAAVGGVLLVTLAGSARIIQLRRAARRHSRADAAQVAAGDLPKPAGGSGAADQDGSAA